MLLVGLAISASESGWNGGLSEDLYLFSNTEVSESLYQPFNFDVTGRDGGPMFFLSFD